MAAAPDYVQQPFWLLQDVPFYLFLAVNLVGKEDCSVGTVLFSGEDTVEKKIVLKEPCFYREDTAEKEKMSAGTVLQRKRYG